MRHSGWALQQPRRGALLLGRFNKHLDAPPATRPDPYDLVRFVDSYGRFLPDAVRDISAGRRKFHWKIHCLFPQSLHVTADGSEFCSVGGRKWVLQDLNDTHRSDKAAEAFLRFDPMGGVHLRRDYHRLCCLLEEHVVNSERQPVGAVGVLELKKIVVSLDLFYHVSRATGVAPEVADVCGRVLPRIAEKWPLPPGSVVEENEWLRGKFSHV